MGDRPTRAMSVLSDMLKNVGDPAANESMLLTILSEKKDATDLKVYRNPHSRLSLLHSAIKLPVKAVVTAFLDAGIPVNSVDTLETGNTVLHACVKAATTTDDIKADYVRMLLDRGADVMAIHPKQKITCLEIAKHKGTLPKTVAALEHGATEPERFFNLLKDAKGSWLDHVQRTLTIACSAPHSARTIRLVKYTSPGSKETALMYAVLRNDPKLVSSLLQVGANANATDDKSSTPLHKAVTRPGGDDNVISRYCRILLKNGADPTIRPRGLKAKDPLQYAHDAGLTKTVATLQTKYDEFKAKSQRKHDAAASGGGGGDEDDSELYCLVGDEDGEYSFVGDMEEYPWDLRGKSREEWSGYLGTNNVPGYFVLRDTDKAFCALTLVTKDKKDPKTVTHWSQLIHQKDDGCFKLKGAKLHFQTLPAMIQAYRDPATCAKQKKKDVPVPLQGHLGGDGGGGGSNFSKRKSSSTADW